MAELVVSKIESYDQSQLELKCDLCRLDGEIVDGVIVCVDCMECLCQTCLEIHSNNEVLKAHITVTKNNLPVNFTSQTMNELKDMIICGTHEMRFEYFCEDHTDFICQLCTRKAHRGCNKIMKIQNIKSSPESVLNEIREIRKWFKDVTEQRNELKELELAEMKIQIKMKTAILAKIKAFLDPSCVGDESDENDELVEDIEVVDSIRADVKRVDKSEDLLRAVLYLTDSEATTVVSRRVVQSLENYSHKTSIQSGIDRKRNMKKVSNRLEVLEAVTDELVNGSLCDDEDKPLNRIIHHIRDTTYLDVDVQTQLNPEINEKQVPNVCITKPSTESSDINTKPHDAGNAAPTNKDVEVQTEGTSNTSSMITLASCTNDHLNASADMDTEPDYDDSGLGISQQCDNSSVVHGTRCSDRIDRGCQTICRTQQRDINIPLSKSSLEFIGSYNVCHDGEEYCDVSGICVLRSGRIALIDFEHDSLKVIDEHFHFKTFFKLNGNPIDICVVNHDFDRVAITLGSRRIETYEISDDTIRYIRGFDLSMYCRGICPISRNTIAVLVSDVESVDESGCFPNINSDKNVMEIQIRTLSNGRIIRSIDKFKKEVNNPSHILQDYHNNIIIGEANQLSAFDRDGDRLWYYNNYKGSKLDNILGMDMDPEGNIYVCSNESNSIHQVSSFNYTKNRVIIPHVPTPCSVAYDPDQERLIVGSENSECVYVYRFI